MPSVFGHDAMHLTETSKIQARKISTMALQYLITLHTFS